MATETQTQTAPHILYTAEATVSGGRHGQGRTSDGQLEVTFAAPKEMGGDGHPGVNPEQLFALGYGACFQNAILGIGGRQHLKVDDCTLTARVGIGRIGNGTFGLQVELIITLPSVADRAVAEKLVDEAHERCPYSNATRGNVDVTLTILQPSASAQNRRLRPDFYFQAS